MLHAAAVTLVISRLFVVRPTTRDPSSAERFPPRDGFISPVPLLCSDGPGSEPREFGATAADSILIILCHHRTTSFLLPFMMIRLFARSPFLHLFVSSSGLVQPATGGLDDVVPGVVFVVPLRSHPSLELFFAFRASLRPLSSLHCLSSSQPFPCTCPPHRQSCCEVSDKNKKPVVCCSLHLFISLLGIRRSTRLRAPILGPCPQTTTSAQTSSCRHFFIFPLFAFSTFSSSILPSVSDYRR